MDGGGWTVSLLHVYTQKTERERERERECVCECECVCIREIPMTTEANLLNLTESYI